MEEMFKCSGRHRNDQFKVKGFIYLRIAACVACRLLLFASKQLDVRQSRPFKRKSVLTQDDLGSLSAAELLRPRFKHLEKHWQELLMLTHSTAHWALLSLCCLAGLQLCQKDKR